MTTITIDRATVEQALEALLNSRPLATEDDFAIKVRKHSEAITALRAALAQQAAADELRRLSAVEAQRDALLEALKGITPSMPPADAPCHYGIVPQEKCGHCGRIAKARAAIKAVEGENHAKNL